MHKYGLPCRLEGSPTHATSRVAPAAAAGWRLRLLSGWQGWRPAAPCSTATCFLWGWSLWRPRAAQLWPARASCPVPRRPSGSGRRALQALARVRDSALNIRNSAADLLDSMQMFTRLLNHGDFVAFATSVAPPERLLGWLQDAAAVLNCLGSLPRAGGQGRGVCWRKGGHFGYRQNR